HHRIATSLLEEGVVQHFPTHGHEVRIPRTDGQVHGLIFGLVRLGNGVAQVLQRLEQDQVLHVLFDLRRHDRANGHALAGLVLREGGDGKRKRQGRGHEQFHSVSPSWISGGLLNMAVTRPTGPVSHQWRCPRSRPDRPSPWVIRSSTMASMTMPRPPTMALPASSRPIARSTSLPRPFTEIIEAMTTIDRDRSEERGGGH